MPQLAQAGKFLSFKRMTASFLVNVVTKKEASEKCKDGSRLSISDKCSLHDVNVVQNSTLRQSNCTKKIARCVAISKLFHSALVPIVNSDVQGASCLHTTTRPF